MRYLDDTLLRGLVDLDAAVGAVEDAFRSLATGTAALQERARTVVAASKLSTMGAVIDDRAILGAKVYSTTPTGRFHFVTLLFDGDDGRPLALLDGGALTAVRTAATSIVAARRMARPDSRVLAVFGAGVQAAAHVEAMAANHPVADVRVVHRRPAGGFVERMAQATGVPVRQVDSAREALDGADLVVTTTRAAEPLFDGSLVPDGAHVTAVGATRPQVRELDDGLIGRADVVAVEWREQARREAGDLIGAVAAGAFDWHRAVELADVVSGRVSGRPGPEAVTIFESVGIGLEDVAVAHLAYRAALAADLGQEL